MPDLIKVTPPAHTGKGLLADFRADANNALVRGMPLIDAGVGRVMKVYGIGGPLTAFAAPAAAFYAPIIAAEGATQIGASGTIVPENQRVVREGIAQVRSHQGLASLLIPESSSSEQTSLVADQAAGDTGGGEVGSRLSMPPVWARDP